MKRKERLLMLFFMSLLMTQLHAQDWPNFNAFKAANAALPPLEEAQQRVVFMGNSITIGWLDSHPEFFENKPYVNRGISGQTTPQMLVRFRTDVLAIDAAAVVILAGTNDIAGNTGPSTLEMILDNIKSMTEIAQANDVKVILCSVLPAYDYPWRPGMDPHIKIPKLNAMIKDYAEKNNVFYLDYFSALEDGNNGLIPSYTDDGVHLTRAGYEVMEPLLENALKVVLP
ncbi:SGNH/GDSL hydrolase family protein [Flavobacteriaceae bacterium]|jgi:lysophospholipase L1-like esterase|nr:acylhydrolase [Flavobacteriaceae bacterium]MDA7712162.1 SGNH/GDSL hydrolase family protein [Flavobacteriaceae bacterium]MDB4306765.1 SGNH/GDSL hydrolase family protein [Flavobacteriaceae bacterium]